MKKINSIFAGMLLIIGLMMSCGDNAPFEPPNGGNGNGGNTGSDIPPIFDDFSEDITISRDGDFLELKTKSVPEHRSPYFEPDHPNNFPYNGSNSNFVLAPYTIAEQNFVFRIPMNADQAVDKSDVPSDAVGLTVSGIVLYGFPDADDFNSFDQKNGHIDENGVYHHHIIPTDVINQVGEDGLVGIMLDGYPIYGPEEEGVRLTPNDLDEFHGHFGVTPHQGGNEVYHYHVTYESPYLLGEKFYGVVGTVTNQ